MNLDKYFPLCQVVVKTVSGSVASWPATGNVTTRPLPVHNIREETRGGGAGGAGAISLAWEPNADSQQDSYKVDTARDDQCNH